jgi:hypothetical protein
MMRQSSHAGGDPSDLREIPGLVAGLGFRLRELFSLV